MPAHKLSSTRVEEATREKVLRAHTGRLLLIVLFGSFLMLTYGYTTVHSDELPAIKLASQVDSLESTPQPTVPPSQPAVAPQDVIEEIQSLAQDVELLKVRVESELEASKTGIEAMRDANDRNFLLFTVISGLVGLFGIVTWVTTLTKARQEHRDYAHEREFYENRARRYEDRSQAEHKSILGLYDEQIEARKGENEHAGRIFALQEENLKEVNTITTAIAAGASENVNSLNTILSTFQRIMDFKVAEAKDAQERVQQMENELTELKEAQRQRVEELQQSAVRLRRSRFIYASPDPDLQRQIVEFRTQLDLVQPVILHRHTGYQPTGVEPPDENRHYGEIYLRRGIIAYCDNDMLKSRDMLRIAERFFPFSEQGIGSMSRGQKLPTAFTQFYLALIEKNYGEMAVAKEHIEKSYAVYGRNEQEELLTPVTRAEILFYLGDMNDARAAIQEVLDRAAKLQQMGSLKRHDANYALRARLLLGNTCYVRREWQQALQHYQDILKSDAGQDSSYYVYHSIAQVYHQLGNEKEARENKRQAYDMLVETDHLRTKVALDTRILLNALAYLCTRAENKEKAKEYMEAILELWLRIQEVDGLQLRLFSFEKKRLVSKDEFWTEVFS
jgi:tetratricopeptide (TPR) repeat protein